MSTYAQGASGEALSERRARRVAKLRVWLSFLVMSLGSFMATLDIQIVASSINEIRAGLSASIDEIQWVQTSYLIAEVIIIPLSGYLSRMLSTRIYFVVSALGFTLASLACAGAWNLGSMVVFRVLQGLFGGGMIPTFFSTLFILFPEPRQRVIPQTIAGMLTMVASSLGPTLGGYITSGLSWHWLFLLNLGPGLLCAWAVWTLTRIDSPRPQMFRDFDLWGLAFMAMFLGGMEYTLDEGPRHDWFAQDSVAVCAALALAGGALFFWRAFTAAHPIVDLRVYRNRNFAVTSLVGVALGMSLYTLIYLTPVFLGEVRGYNPLQIGKIIMVQGCTMFFAAPLAAQLIARTDARWVMAAGFVLIALGALLNARLTVDWGFDQFLLPQMLRGAGYVMTFIPLTGFALGTLPAEEVQNASGLYTVSRNLGGALGLAAINTLINQRNWLHWQQMVDATRASRAPVREALAGMQMQMQPALEGVSGAASYGVLVHKVQQQVATLTYADMYWLLGYLVLLPLLLLPLVQRPRAKPEMDVAAAAA